MWVNVIHFFNFDKTERHISSAVHFVLSIWYYNTVVYFWKGVLHDLLLNDI